VSLCCPPCSKEADDFDYGNPQIPKHQSTAPCSKDITHCTALTPKILVTPTAFFARTLAAVSPCHCVCLLISLFDDLYSFLVEDGGIFGVYLSERFWLIREVFPKNDPRTALVVKKHRARIYAAFSLAKQITEKTAGFSSVPRLEHAHFRSRVDSFSCDHTLSVPLPVPFLTPAQVCSPERGSSVSVLSQSAPAAAITSCTFSGTCVTFAPVAGDLYGLQGNHL
jgi:hypothetical protein